MLASPHSFRENIAPAAAPQFFAEGAIEYRRSV